MQKSLCSILVFVLLLSSFGSASINGVYAASGEENVTSTSASTQVWTSDSLTKVFQSTLVNPNASQNLEIIAAKNEYRSGQIVIRSDHLLSDIQVTPSGLVGPNNFTLSNVSINLIEYLKLRRHSPEVDPGEILYPPDASSMLYPDPLLPTSQLAELPANTTQPFWYKVFVPSDAPAGDYYGTVHINANQEQYAVDVHLRVHDVSVPELRNTEYMVDNWLVSAGWAPHGVAAIDYQYGIVQWSAEWWTLMDRMAAYMADHRNNVLWLSPIAFLQKDSSIDTEGNIVFDWTDFDRFVQMFKDKGSGHYLHGVSLLLGKNVDDRYLLSILENKNGVITQDNVTIDDPKAEAWLAKYLPALAEHLQEKGWLDTFIQSGGDEPKTNQDNSDNNWVYEKIHTLGTAQDSNGATHGMKTTDAQVIRQEQSAAGLDIFVVKQDVFDLNQSFHKEMQRLGKELWLYICNYPQGKYLNRLYDMHLTKTLLPHWYTFKNGMTGYLHYGFNIWSPEPISIGKSVEVSSETGWDYWAPSRATDGVVTADVRNLGWSSKSNETANAEEYITINLGNEQKIRKVAIMPRIDEGNFGYGFPVDFTIETYDSATSSWIAQVTEVDFPKPEKTTYNSANTTYNLPGIMTQYVRVKATKLGCSGNQCTDYRLQLSEIEITGEDDVLHESDYGSPGDAWLIYPDKENLDVMSSMRSEVQLEGIQDYELLKLLEKDGKGEFAQKIAGSIISSGTKYNRESEAILAARKAVLDLLTDQYALETFVDSLDNMNLIFGHSEFVGLDSSNPGNTGGDAGRLARTAGTDQFIVYNKPNIRSFEVQLYSDSTDDVEILGSSDNKSWLPVTVQKSERTDTQYGWYGFTLSSSKVPQGIDYLKIVLKGTNLNSWTPQIGKVTINYGYEVNEKDSLVDNNGFEAGIWPSHKDAEIDTEVRATGKKSARLTATGQGPYVESALAAIGAGKKHSFSVRLKTEGISSPDGVKVELMQVDEAGRDIGIYSKSNGLIQTGGTHNWTEFKIDSVETAATSLRVIVRVQANITGTVWIDDVVLLDSEFIQTYIDYFNDMSGLYANSALLGLEGGSPNIAGGDTSRLARFENSDQYFVYNKPLISEFSLKAYTATKADIDFYASSDNVTWTHVSVLDRNKEDTDWGWFSVTKVAQNIPRNTNFMKAVIRETNDNSWSPQIGEVMIKYGHEESEPESLIEKSGFETGLWAVQSGAELDAEVKHSGRQSAKLIAGSNASIMSSSVVDVQIGKSYSTSLWLKTEGISDEHGVKVEIMQVDEYGNDLGLLDTGSQTIAVGGTTAWTEYSIHDMTTLAPGIRFIVRTKAGTTGKAWIDDVVVSGNSLIYKDTLDNMDGIFEKSSHFGLDSSNPVIANGDTSRIARMSNTNEYLIYHVRNMNSFLAKFYSQSSAMKVDFYGSPDNSTWTKLEIKEVKSLTPNGWTNINVSNDTLPLGTNYLKVLFRDDNEVSWSPQLGEISFTYGYGGAVKPEPVSLISNGGFELGPWVTSQRTTLDASIKHGGDFSVKLTPSGGDAYTGSDSISIDSAKRYVLSLWTKDMATAPNGASVEIMQLDEHGAELGLYVGDSGALSIGGSTEWKKFVFKDLGDFAAGTTALKVIVRAGTTLWVDDVVLLEDKVIARAAVSGSEFATTDNKALTLTARNATSGERMLIVQYAVKGDATTNVDGGTFEWLVPAGTELLTRDVILSIEEQGTYILTVNVTDKSSGDQILLKETPIRVVAAGGGNGSGTNHAPTATASITGAAQVGSALTGTHTFSDPDEGDTEGASTYRWLISSTLDGAYSAIVGATSASYSPIAVDQGKHIKFEVTPVDNHGLAGTPAVSQPTLAIAASSTEAGPNDNNNSSSVVTSNPESPTMQKVTESQLKEGNGTIPLQSGKESLSLPMNVAEWLQNHDLIVQAGQATIVIPSSVLKALQEQAVKEALDATSIIVKVVSATVTTATGDSSLKSGGTVYELELYAVNNKGKQTRLASFTDAVHIELSYQTSQNKDLIGIYYYNETNLSWEYVGGILDASKGIISTELHHFSKYAVMEYDKQFADLPITHWASHAIKTLAAKYVVSGVDGNSFKPDGLTTRAEFTAMLVRAFNLKAVKETAPFKDIVSDAWYAEAVRTAYAAGLIQGVADDKFTPNAQITREQMATLLVRASEYAKHELTSDNDGLNSYQDRGNVSGWATEAVNKAIQSGLMNGKKAGYFSPSDKVTRAETAQAIWNLLK
ncbi:S-layer homology domain-containing protein [Cohnella abietis]|uniref:F5/8 type C domain-containing protein n=1 Tax=Cohnella abietis TaxID=2507935 RepID=A0A3T1DE92_9BACL|nr:S-layer homology domain-containing protein [Cohnella abietis]BBI36344.1 hypothetical protein KCTCHS21_57430 [Cohnella abietis]